jgi:ribulose-5-phosphate 4-epimerase/fuculose-1-phosphate aldolase
MGSADLAERIVTALTDGPEPLAGAVLLERHGAVSVGQDLVTAVDRLELIEVLCRAWGDALLLRAARNSLDRD